MTPRSRSDVIPWIFSLYQQEFDDNFNIDSMTDTSTHQAVLQLIEHNWGSFCEGGALRPMLDFEFCIDNRLIVKVVCFWNWNCEENC